MASNLRVGPYVLVRELARGAMGVVYEAQAPDGGRVALKVLLHASSPEAMARFDRERRLLVELSGAPGFVPLLDAGVERGRPWLVMPLMGGGSLRDRLRRGTPSVDDAVELGHQLGVAIGRAHARGIVHRDLKPENVLYEHEGRDAPPRIADLGVARHFRRDDADGARSASLSRSGALLGTACYMSPEQLTDPRRVGPPADVFALAQIVYECLAGVTPFARDSLQETLAALVDGRPDPLRVRAPHAPAWLEAVLARALDADPARRYADGQAFARALALGRRAPARRRTRRAVPWLPWLAVGALALAAAGAALVVARRTGGPSAPVASAPGGGGAPEAPVAPATGPSPALNAQREPPSAGASSPDASSPEDRDATDASGAGRASAPGPEPEPRDANGWVARGAALARAGQHDAAVEAYRRAIDLNPRRATRILLVHALIAAERVDEAIAEADRLVEESADPAGLVARGAALLSAGRLRGLRDLERVVAEDPEWANAWTWLSTGRLRARQYDEALAAAERSLAIHDSPDVALRNRGIARLVLGDAVGARRDLARYRAALDAKAAALDVPLQAALSRLGAPTDPAPDAKTEAARLVAEAWLALGANDAGAHVRLVERALELAPEHAEALAMKGARTPGDEGLALLDRAIALGPVAGWMLRMRAVRRLAASDVQGAADDIERMVALDGESESDLLLLAQVLRLAKRRRALDVAAAVTQAYPTSVAGWSMLARLRREWGDVPSALEAARRATELGPDDAEAWRELGQALLRRSRWDDAIAAFERALALAPGDPEALSGRGVAFTGARRFADGIRDLELALAAQPEDPLGWAALAGCYAQSRDFTAALAAVERSLALRPGNPEALRVRAIVRDLTGDREGARADVASLRRRAPELFELDPELRELEAKLSR